MRDRRDGEAANRFLTISNLLSLFRALLAIPFAVVMLSDLPDATFWGIGLLAVAALTDKLDGVLARRRNEETEWGKILDPLADKIGMGAVAVVLVVVGMLPLWFLVAVLARDVLILAGGIVLKARRAVVPPSNQAGKWTIGVLAMTMLCAMLRLEFATALFIWLSVGMLVFSLALYMGRFAELTRSSNR